MISWLHQRYASGAGSMGLLALGGRGSGKSYTLFGGDRMRDEERGVLPRLLEELFDPNSFRARHVTMRIYLLDGENVVDMLTAPPTVHATTDCTNVTTSPTLGPLLLPLQEALCRSAYEAVEVLYRALLGIGHYVHSTANTLTAHHTVVHVQWVGPSVHSLSEDSPIVAMMPMMPGAVDVRSGAGAAEGDPLGSPGGAGGGDTGSVVSEGSASLVNEGPRGGGEEVPHLYSLFCAEISSFECPWIVPVSMDRLSTFGRQFSSVRLLQDMVRKCPSKKYLNGLGCTNNSILTYLLQPFLFDVS